MIWFLIACTTHEFRTQCEFDPGPPPDWEVDHVAGREERFAGHDPSGGWHVNVELDDQDGEYSQDCLSTLSDPTDSDSELVPVSIWQVPGRIDFSFLDGRVSHTYQGQLHYLGPHILQFAVGVELAPSTQEFHFELESGESPQAVQVAFLGSRHSAGAQLFARVGNANGLVRLKQETIVSFPLEEL